MPSIGELDKLIDITSKSLSTVIPIVEKELDATKIDIIFVSAVALVIPEYGISGNSPSPDHVCVSFDSKFKQNYPRRIKRNPIARNPSLYEMT